jgi:hypothetical protein
MVCIITEAVIPAIMIIAMKIINVPIPISALKSVLIFLKGIELSLTSYPMCSHGCEEVLPPHKTETQNSIKNYGFNIEKFSS